MELRTITIRIHAKLYREKFEKLSVNTQLGRMNLEEYFHKICPQFHKITSLGGNRFQLTIGEDK